MILRKTLIAWIAAGLFSTAFAGPLVIQMTGVDLTYDGSTITSSTSPDTLTSVVIDGTPYLTDIDLDLTIPGVTGLAAASGSSTTSAAGGTLDLGVDTGALSLTLDPTEVSYIDAGGFATFVFAATIGGVDSQSLPDGFVICEPVSVSFSTQVSSMSDDGMYITGFTSSGTGEIMGVPEPASCVLVMLGSVALIFRRRR